MAQESCTKPVSKKNKVSKLHVYLNFHAKHVYQSEVLSP